MSQIVKPTPKDQREINLNKNIKLPRNRYSVRIKEEKFQISKKGNPCIVLNFEIISPDVITNPADGTKVNVAGCRMKEMYITLSSVKDEKTSQRMFDDYSALRSKLGVPIPEGEGVDISNPPKLFEGLIVDAICDGEEYTQRQDPTPEQVAKEEQGDPIKGPDGKDMISYFPFVHSILGLASTSAQAAAATRPY